MKKLVNLFITLCLIFIATGLFAQTSGSSNSQISTNNIPLSTIPSWTVSPVVDNTWESGSANTQSIQKFEESHPRFENLADKHPQFAGYMYDNKDKIMDKGVSGKDIWQHRDQVKARAQKKVHSHGK
ncbi:MAG: hypothetical protein H0W62_08375 [Chitinophagales bacterium]|nr:hypothetical protein [Chitinophagales bacterium]